MHSFIPFGCSKSMKLLLTDLLRFCSISCNLLALTAVNVGFLWPYPDLPTNDMQTSWWATCHLVGFCCKKVYLGEEVSTWRACPAKHAAHFCRVGGFLVRFSTFILLFSFFFFCRFSYIFFLMLMPCAGKYILLSACFEYSRHFWQEEVRVLVRGGSCSGETSTQLIYMLPHDGPCHHHSYKYFCTIFRCHTAISPRRFFFFSSGSSQLFGAVGGAFTSF